MLNTFQKVFDRYDRLEKYTKYALIIVFAGLAIRLSLSFYTSVSGDACWHLAAARYAGRTGSLPLFEPLGRDIFWPPPLFHLMNAFSYASLDWMLGEASLKLAAPLLGTLFLWYAFLVVRKLFDSKTAFYSTLFLFMIPIQLYQSAIGYPDIAFGLFSLMAIYYSLQNRLLVSAAATGLALLTKTNAFFIIPAIIYILYRSSPRGFLKKLLVFMAIALLIALPWYARNWLYLGNPIWPFMNNMFHGYESPSVPEHSFIFDAPSLGSSFYLSMFGVPNGDMRNLMLIENQWLIAGWVALTAIFISFFIAGFLYFLKKRKTMRSMGFDVVILLFASLFFFQIIMAMNIGDFQTRYIMPALLFFSVFWSVGLMAVLKKSSLKIATAIFLVISASTFIGGEFVKSKIAGDMWNAYEGDFDWVHDNTDKNSLILTPNSQCYSYKLDRYTASEMFVENGFYSRDRIDYVFYPDFTGNSLVVSTYTKKPDLLGSSLVYENNATGIRLYKINRA